MSKKYTLDTLSQHLIQRYNNTKDHLNKHLPTPLRHLREQALQAFTHQGLPNKKNEAYRHTPILQKLTQHLSHPTPNTQSSTHNTTHTLRNLDAYHLTLHPHQSTPQKHSTIPQNLHILTLREAYNTYPQLINTYFTKLAPNHKDSLVALNTLLFHHPHILYLQPDTTLDKPLIIHHPPHTTSHTRLLIILGDNTQLQLIETFPPSSNTLIHRVAEIVLQSYAKLDYYHIQTEQTPQALHIPYTYIHQHKATHLNHYSFTLAGELIRNHLQVNLTEPHSEAHLYGIYQASESAYIENHLIVNHQAPYTTSNQHYKGLAGNTAIGIFKGGIYVDKEAQHTQASQKHHAWLLHPKAKIKAQPLLSIHADEVQCSHGATISQPDEEQVFYLSTRGYSKKQAYKLLLQGFCQNIINKVNLCAIKPYIAYSTNSSDT